MAKTNYAQKNTNELRALLHERNLEAPLGDDGKLIRKIAMDMLKKWDEENEEKPERFVRVVFHKSAEEASLPYVFLSLNGKAYQAPYEKEVVIPESVLRSCCDLAKRTERRMSNKPTQSGKNLHYEEYSVMTQPYTFLGYVEQLEEVEESN